MRKLKESYWNKFLKIDSCQKAKRNGILFEDLVEHLLEIKYGCKWIRTPKSHDNNRDFYLTTDEFSYWAECKNYKDAIALDTIAPTLVMAQIFDVNKVIFFSYSDINSSAKNKLLSFGEKTKKNITIFSGNTLDELIVECQKFLPKKFRPKNNDIAQTNPSIPLECNFYFIQTPVLGANVYDRDVMAVSDALKITYNTIFEIAFVCINNSLENDYEVEIQLNNQVGTDNNYFTLENHDIENGSQLLGLQKIPAAEGLIRKYYFKSNRFRSLLILPVFQVNIRKGNQLIKTFNSPIKQVRNQWIGKTILIGEQYRAIVKKVEQEILDNDQFSCFTIYGASGTGKTRLLNEIVDVLLKHKYRIANFIGSADDSAYVLLKELIYFVYEIPHDDILKGLEDDIFALSTNNSLSNAQKAYQLAQRFAKSESDADLIDVIEDSFDILYEKISREHIAIVIDNIQFFGDALIYFLQKFIMYSKHQSRHNFSVLILSINEDYLTEKTNTFLKYIKKISEDTSHFCYSNVTGFHNKNQGILFLRELMHIGNDNLDEQFEIILKKSTLKPYYIYQAVYYLYEKEAISESNDEKGYLPCMEKFCDAIAKMPPKIKDILCERWNNFLSKTQYNKEEIVTTIACVYIFRELTPQAIQLLSLNWNIINLLEERMFFRINEDDNYCFDHDIIENFFVSIYPNMNILVINKIRKLRVGRKLDRNSFVKLYYQLWNSRMTSQKIQQIYEQTLVTDIPLKLAQSYYKKFLDVVLKRQQKYSSSEDWMGTVFGICNLCKNSIGIRLSEVLFNSVNSYLVANKLQKIIFTNAFRNYLNIYSDTLFFQRRHKDAIYYLEGIKKCIPPKENDQINALKAMLNNRLLINYRELPSEYYQRQARSSLREAEIAAASIKNPNLRDEFTYLNLSDEGYFYYCLYSQKKKLLSIWNKCMNYSPDRLPQKAMNYYRKQLQLELIRQDFNSVFNTLSEAQEYMEIHYSSNTEKLIFKLSFSLYKIMAWIQENPVDNHTLLIKELTSATELSYLLAKKDFQSLLMLRAIVSYYNNDISSVYYNYREAYNLFCCSAGARFYDEKKELLLSNIYISFQQLHILERAGEFLGQDDCSKFNNLNLNLPKYEAAGIQRTKDRLFNLPAI